MRRNETSNTDFNRATSSAERTQPCQNSNENHAQYLASWLRVLKADSCAIFSAASKAQQATDWMMGRDGDSAATVEVAAA